MIPWIKKTPKMDSVVRNVVMTLPNSPLIHWLSRESRCERPRRRFDSEHVGEIAAGFSESFMRRARIENRDVVCRRLDRATVKDSQKRGFKNQFKVEPKTLVPYVFKVHTHPFFERDLSTTSGLPGTG